MLAYCAKCGTAYAVDLTACPHCGSAEVEMVHVPAKLVDGVPVMEVASTPSGPEADPDA
jgi:uncharacterized OB-fold protein